MEHITLHYPHDACDIYFNEELQAVQTIWKSSLGGKEFRDILDNIIRLLQEKNVHLIIADARNLKTILKEDQDWIISDWYHRAVAAGFAMEALIVRKDTFNEYVIQKIVHHYDDQKIKTIYFYSYSEAVKWLKENVSEYING